MWTLPTTKKQKPKAVNSSALPTNGRVPSHPHHIAETQRCSESCKSYFSPLFSLYSEYVFPVLMDVLSSPSMISAYLFPNEAVAHVLSYKYS